MAFLPCTFFVLICGLVHNAKGQETMSTSPMNSSVHMNQSSTEILPSVHWINGSCRIMPSTCLCDNMHAVNVSMNMSMINMTSPSSQVVSMTMTPDPTGSSYLNPMNSTIHPNMTFNHSIVPCTCYGIRTWCRKNHTVSPSPTMSGSLAQPVNTAGGNNNNNNNNNNVVSSGVSTTAGALSGDGSVSATAPLAGEASPAEGTPSVNLPASLDASALMNGSVLLVPSMSMIVSESMASLDMMMSVSASASMSVMMEASTTPGGEVIPEPTTLPPVCTTDCAGVDCGNATVNSCGHCVGGTTGVDENIGKDCNNVCNGTARNDTCGQCSNPPADDPNNVESPFRDCNGDCFKGAMIDSCGNCTGGLTGRLPDFWRDACGICGGGNSSCMGCDGVPNSGQIRDSCGACGGDGSTCTNITSIHPSLLPSTSTSGRIVNVIGAGLDGDSIKCFFDGQESAETKQVIKNLTTDSTVTSKVLIDKPKKLLLYPFNVFVLPKGVVVNRTFCQCTIPDNAAAGTKSFTVKVVKDNVDSPTADLQIEIYDAATVKITAVSPTEFLTGTPAQLTIEGPGLIENSAAVCVVRTDTVVKIPAVFDSGNYSCSLPVYDVAINMTVGLSINGIHELASDADLNRIVYATAPAVTSGQFTDTGAKIIIAFDHPIATAQLATCSAIFSTGLPSLGTNPGCIWTDGRHLEISPDVDASIEPTNILTFQTDVIKQDQMYSKIMNGNVQVLAPANPVAPIPLIVGPTQISSCGNLTLDGRQSSGGGGRSLQYNWTLVSPTDAAISSALAAAGNKVTIPGSMMTAGSTYEFKLAVTNFLSSEAKETTISVTKSSEPLPEVTLDGPLQGKAFAADSFYITAIAKAASCSNEKALSYSWTVACTSADAKTRAESSPGFVQTADKAALKIDAGSLVGGKTYTFTVVVSLTATPSTATTVSTDVVVEWSPLEPAIAGGDRTLGRDSGSVQLDAKSSTIDPDNAPGELSCTWTCTDTSNEQPCYSPAGERISFPSDCLVTIASTEFAAGKVYKIESGVSKGSRTGTSTMLLTVVEGNPPAVSVVKPTMKVLADQKVSLDAKYTSAIEPTVEWVCAQEDDYRYIDISDQSVISSTSNQYNGAEQSFVSVVLKANVLTPGSKYKFIVNVHDGSKIGSSNIIVEVRSGPTSGSFEVTPTSLEQLQEVTLKASLWVTESDAYPLEYEFGFLDNTGIFQSWGTQTNSEYTIAVPPGYGPNNILTLRMKVKDSFGSMKYVDKNITVTAPSSLDETLAENLLTDSLQEAQDSGDYSKAVPTMMNLLTVVKNSNSSDNLTTLVMNTTAETLIAAVDATLLDEEKAKPILEGLLDLDLDVIQTPKEILDSFEKVAVAHDGNLEPNKIEESLRLLDDLAAKCDLTDSDVVEDLVSADDEIASSLAKEVALGSEVVEKSSARCDITAQHSLLVGDITSKSGAQSSQVEFGNELRTKYGFWECDSGKYCMGVKLTFVNYKQDYYTAISSTKPGILGSKVLSVSLRNPETGSSLPVSSLNDPITITFETGLPSAGKTFKGYYYSESQNKWSDYGLTSSMLGSSLKVTTNHLTSFAPAEEDEVSPTGGVTTLAPSSDNVFQVSFVLSNTTWNDTYANSSHPDYEALQNAILTELNNVYNGDTTLKNIVLDKFEPSGDKVKVVLKMTFDDSNDDPGAKLKDSLSDGKLGNIGVDKDSLKWTNSYAKADPDSDEDTELIVGTVFGIFFGLVLILLGAAWLKNRQSRRKVGSSHSSVQEDPSPPDEPDVAEETPA